MFYFLFSDIIEDEFDTNYMFKKSYQLGGIKMEKRPYVAWEKMNQFLIDAFMGYGIPEQDASICADVLLESDRKGIESHGCNRFKPIYIDRIKAGILNPITNMEIIKDTFTTQVMDAHDGMGMVASYHMMQSLIEKAKVYGMAMGVIRNSSHYGIAGYYTDMAAKAGMIGISGTNARGSIAPTFGVENMLGTNPLTFSIPTDEDFDFCLDCATSIYQRGKIEYYARIGKDTPASAIVTQDNVPLSDSNTILRYLVEGKAALAPLGGVGDETAGYKGFGYASVVEILSSALSNGVALRDIKDKDEEGNPRPYHLGHFFIVINPEFFMGLDVLRARAGDICRTLRESKKAKGHDRIYTAGEVEHDIRMQRKDLGVPLSKEVQKEVLMVNEALQLGYVFDFE